MKIADYFSQKLNQSQINKNIDEIQSWTSNLLSKYQENVQSNNSLFNEGNELKSNMINVSKAYDYLSQIKGFTNKNRNNQLALGHSNENRLSFNNSSRRNLGSESAEIVPYRHTESTSTQGHKWSKILEYLNKNPIVLMNAIPSPRSKSCSAQSPIGNSSKVKPNINISHYRNKWNEDSSNINKNWLGSVKGKISSKSINKSVHNSSKIIVIKPTHISVIKENENIPTNIRNHEVIEK